MHRIIGLNDNNKVVYEVDPESPFFSTIGGLSIVCKIDHLTFRGIELVKLFLTIQAKEVQKQQSSVRQNSNILAANDVTDVQENTSLSKIGEGLDQ